MIWGPSTTQVVSVSQRPTSKIVEVKLQHSYVLLCDRVSRAYDYASPYPTSKFGELEGSLVSTRTMILLCHWAMWCLLYVSQEHRLYAKGILRRFPRGRDCSCESQRVHLIQLIYAISTPVHTAYTGGTLRSFGLWSPISKPRHISIWTQRYISNFVVS